MDDIAAAAQVSKQTIYTHFTSKEQLFADLVLGNADRAEQFAASVLSEFDGEADLEAALSRLARRYLAAVIQPDVIRLRRLVIGEAARFPDVAREYYERVPARVYAAFADLIARLTREGRLRAPDSALAAEHFAWLLLGPPLDRGLFHAGDEAPRADLDHLAEAGVRAFLAAYR